MIEFVLCIQVAPINLCHDKLGLTTDKHGLGDANKVRAMWKRIVAERRSLHLFLRMHLLQKMCRGNEERLSELRRRTGTAATPERQKVVGRPFWPPSGSDEAQTSIASLVYPLLRQSNWCRHTPAKIIGGQHPLPEPTGS